MKTKSLIIALIFGFNISGFAQLELNDVIDDIYFRLNGLQKAKIVFKNYKKYLKKAKKGEAKYQCAIGLLHAHEDNWSNPVKLNYEKSIFWFKKASDQNHVNSQYHLGKIYFNGDYKNNKDYNKSLLYFSKAASKGHVESQYFLGKHYHEGFGTKKNYSKAINWYNKAIKKGDLLSELEVAFMHIDGKGYPIDKQKGLELLEACAEKGLLLAFFKIGNLYYEGKKIPKDYNKAYVWFEKMSKYRSRNSGKAIYFLAKMNEEGLGRNKNNDLAKQLYIKSAHHMYIPSYEIIKDYDLDYLMKTGIGKAAGRWAIEYFTKKEDAEAIYKHARIYSLKKFSGGLYSLKKAANYYRQSSNLGNIKAKYFYGVMQLKGKYLEKDSILGIKNITEAAQAGFPRAQHYLSTIYFNNTYAERDFTKSFYWCKKSALNNNNNSYFPLAYMYEKGLGTEKNYNKAFSWYSKSAAQGDISALEKTAVFYERGLGTNIDKNKATLIRNEIHSIIACKYCGGTGIDACTLCSGSGEKSVYDFNGKELSKSCHTCSGSGKSDCMFCYGTGKYGKLENTIPFSFLLTNKN